MHAKVHNFTCKRKRLMIQFGHDVFIYYIFGNLTYVATIFFKVMAKTRCVLLIYAMLIIINFVFIFLTQSQKSLCIFPHKTIVLPRLL
jgi:hypothetical protein